MPDIKLSVQIEAPAAKIYPLVCSGSGFSKWWAKDVTERRDGQVDLGFFSRAMVYSLQLTRVSASAEAEWACKSGKEWDGTKLLFQLTENKGQTLLRFSHANWAAETEYFVSCSATWGALMFRIKAESEGHARGPLFSMNGWAL